MKHWLRLVGGCCAAVLLNLLCLPPYTSQDFNIVSIRTCRPSVVDAALLGAPGLAGKVSAVLWLQRSNAVLHLHAVLQQSGALGSSDCCATGCVRGCCALLQGEQRCVK